LGGGIRPIPFFYGDKVNYEDRHEKLYNAIPEEGSMLELVLTPSFWNLIKFHFDHEDEVIDTIKAARRLMEERKNHPYEVRLETQERTLYECLKRLDEKK
jgi:hypothetical protein